VSLHQSSTSIGYCWQTCMWHAVGISLIKYILNNTRITHLVVGIDGGMPALAVAELRKPCANDGT
jgi:hypothetical protein